MGRHQGSGHSAEGFSRLEKELVAERASALARIAATLEDLLQALARLEPPPAHDPAAVAEHRRHHAALREKALRYRWYLEVQRESVGITRHEGLDALYPIPPLLTPEP